MPTCTCCAVHNQGAHRTGQLVSQLEHLTPPDPPGLVRARSALERAVKREGQAHEAWSVAESARRRFELELMTTWRNHPGGIKSAPTSDRDELDRLLARSTDLLDNLKHLGEQTVEARRLAAVEQHKATQLMIANW